MLTPCQNKIKILENSKMQKKFFTIKNKKQYMHFENKEHISFRGKITNTHDRFDDLFSNLFSFRVPQKTSKTRPILDPILQNVKFEDSIRDCEVSISS